MSKESSSTSSGIGFCGLLTTAFIVLKLCHVIDWHWMLVLSPSWIPIAIVVICFLIYTGYKAPFYIKTRNKRKAIKAIMMKTGESFISASIKYNEERGIKKPKSLWEQKLDEARR